LELLVLYAVVDDYDDDIDDAAV